MLFNSSEYLVLLTVALAAYWATPWLLGRQVIVLLASLWFYMSWSKVFLVMLVALIAVNWILGWALAATRKKRWLVLACIINLGLLAYFKYAQFFVDNLFAALGVIGGKEDAPHLSIILPLGISFYVFELLSYLIDIHRGKGRHEKNPIAFALFVLFFPHLIAGPICRAEQFIPQVNQLQRPRADIFYNGAYMFLAGFALKCGIADGIAPYVNVIFKAPVDYSGFDNLLAAVGFGIQILCDFWGYSLMALGAALLFGFVLPANFNAPYAAFSIREFWRRWHITLSNWLRDYLYISMGGARVDTAWKVQRNLALTMLLGGLWHGASWNFVIWGAIHGMALVVHRWFEASPAIPGVVRGAFRWPPVAWLLTMSVVFIAWIFFRAPDLQSSVGMLMRIVTPAVGWTDSRLPPLFFEIALLYLPLQWLVHRSTYECEASAQPLRWQVPAVVMLTVFSLVYYVQGNDFIYFQF